MKTKTKLPPACVMFVHPDDYHNPCNPARPKLSCAPYKGLHHEKLFTHEIPHAVIPCATIKEARALVKAHARPRPKPAKKLKEWYYLKAGEVASRATDFVDYNWGFPTLKPEWDNVRGYDGHIVTKAEADARKFRRPLNRKDGR